MTNKTTINDLAKEAGVSIKTISRFLNSPQKVSQSTKDKINLAIDKIGFVENKVAKSLATGNSEYIAVIVPNMELSYFADLVNRITLYAMKFNYKCIVYVAKDEKQAELKFINEMIAHNVKGIITFSHNLRANELENININLVAVEREIGNYNYIVCDNYLGGSKAAEHLIELGCTHFLHLNSEYIDYIPAAKRYDGFKENVENYDELISSCIDLDEESIFDFLNNKIDSRKTGIFCASDNIARKVINYLVINNYKVGEDVFVIGFDNSSISKNTIIPITTLDQDLDKITKLSVDCLINNSDDLKVVLKPKLIKRSSTLKLLKDEC